jgi:hypothetical protein
MQIVFYPQFLKASEMSNKVNVFQKECSSVSWGLEPIKMWMRFISVLPPCANFSYLFFVSGGCLIFNLSVHCAMLFVFLHWDNNTFFATTGKTVFEKATFSWLQLINYASNAIHSFGIHSVLIFMLNTRWKDLEKSLQQSEFLFRNSAKKKINSYRRFCVTGIIYTIFSVSSLSFSQ